MFLLKAQYYVDSLTHITLGACIGEAMLGRSVGKKALLLGAVAQSLPDFDGLAALWLSTTDNLLVHRGLTHSLPVGTLVAGGLALLARRWQPKFSVGYWFLFFAIQIGVHDLLDTTNAYGTGLLEPFSHQRFSAHLLYVADPFFTLPLLLAFCVLVIGRGRMSARFAWAASALVMSLGYVGYAYVNKSSVESIIRHSLAVRHIKSTAYFTTPTPFNAWLWYTVAASQDGYYVGYRSVFEPRDVPTAFTYFPKRNDLLAETDDLVAVDALTRFANGYYTVESRGGTAMSDTLRFNVLRFGQVLGWQQPTAPFAFQYWLGPNFDNRLVVQRGRVTGWNVATLRRMYNRIFSPKLK